MLHCLQLRPAIISTFILLILAPSPSLESGTPPSAVPQSGLTLDTPLPTDFPALGAASNVTLPQPANDAHLLNARFPVPYSRLSIVTSYDAVSLYSEDSYALLSWLQYKCMRIIVDNGRDDEAPIRYTEGPARVSGRTLTYTINEYVVGAEKLLLSDVATVAAGLVMLLRHLGVEVLAFDVARDGGPSPVMTGSLSNPYGGGAHNVAVD